MFSLETRVEETGRILRRGLLAKVSFTRFFVCSRISFDLKALEKLRFGCQQLIHARFSLSRIEPVPFHPNIKHSLRKPHSICRYSPARIRPGPLCPVLAFDSDWFLAVQRCRYS
jgi:hypothetical protein